jgi:hypothetical protein
MSGSNKLYLGSVAQVDGSDMTIIAGKQLKVIDAPTGNTSVANKKYIDDEVEKVHIKVRDILDGASIDLNSLKEVKEFAESITASGATDLAQLVTTEATARSNADATLTTAISDEVTARSNAVSAEAATRTAEDAKLNMLAIKSSKTMLYVSDVYADSSTLPKPLELCSYPSASNAFNFDGWRMRNDVALSKFNFYVPSNGLKVGDVKAMYLELCAPSVVSMPFITIYTKIIPPLPGQPNRNYASWYRSKKTYINNPNDVLVPGSNYNMVAKVDETVDTFNPAYFIRHDTEVDMTATGGTKNLDYMLPTDDILFFAISSNSSSAVGNVECIISKFKIQLATGINEFVFSNTHIFVDYMKQKQVELWKSLFASSSTDDPFMNNYQIPARTTY